MKTLCLENLKGPEYYHEIPGYDSRIAIMKFLDARETIGFAHISLSFAGTSDYDDFDKNLVRAIHTRHAVIDLNSSFDLLLQIPWMFYRAWSSFNNSGVLRTKDLYNVKQIIRNKNGWVNKAEQECSYLKLIAYCKSNSLLLGQEIESFHKDFIENRNRPFTIRSLCNAMKHNHVIPFKELYVPYDCTVVINGHRNKPQAMNAYFVTEQDFFDKENPCAMLGKISTSLGADLSIDIEYYGGEKFRFIDCSHDVNRVSIADVLSECLRYNDALVNLYEKIYSSIYPKIFPCLTHKPQSGQGRIEEINLEKYFFPLGNSE